MYIHSKVHHITITFNSNPESNFVDLSFLEMKNLAQGHISMSISSNDQIKPPPFFLFVEFTALGAF